MLRKKNKDRLVRMYFIIQIFDAFTQRNLYMECLKQRDDKNKSLETSKMINKLFGMKTTPSDFQNDDDDLANKALKYNNIMQELLDIASESSRLNVTIIEKVVKKMEFENRPALIKSWFLQLSELIKYYTLFHQNCITKNDFQERMYFLSNNNFFSMPMKAKLIMLKKIELMYLEIEAKNTDRLHAKILAI